MQSPENKQLWVSVQLQMGPPCQPPPFSSSVLRRHCGRGRRKKKCKSQMKGKRCCKKKLFLYMLFSQIKLKYYFNKRRNCAECLRAPPPHSDSTCSVSVHPHSGTCVKLRMLSSHTSSLSAQLTWGFVLGLYLYKYSNSNQCSLCVHVIRWGLGNLPVPFLSPSVAISCH